MSPLAIYVHTPFCPTKCGYCDFNSYAMEGKIMERTVRATIQEIEDSPAAGRSAKTIFFGGGTPTYLPTELLLMLLDRVIKIHPPTSDCEITSEANPGTVDSSKFDQMRRAGFNRISLGAQSFLDTDLLRLGRVHRAGEIERAVDLARSAGFDNLNLDLMFSLPNQSRRAWQSNLDRAISLEPEHLSLYCLTIEENTAFYKERLRGQLELPDDQIQVEMYDYCCDRMSAEGYEQYEISNFAKPGFRCRHNLEYWDGSEYAGYGPGAVGALETPVGRIRATNLKHPVRYCEAIEAGKKLTCEEELLTPEILRVEQIMLGLRLNQGIPFHLVEGSDGLDAVKQRGWAQREDQWLRLTPIGRHFCSEVAIELM